MTTIFYQEKFNPQIPLTGLFMEHLGVKIEQAGGVSAEIAVGVIKDCLLECDVLEEVSEDQLIGVVKRINDLAEAPAKEDSADASTGKGKFFAGYLTDWANGLDYAKLCLYLADYSYHTAREYYEKIDQQIIIAIAHDKLRQDFENARVVFEASLFGFGGSYGNTPKEGEEVIDLEGGERANRAMEQLTKGFF